MNWKLIIDTESAEYTGLRIVYCSTYEAALREKNRERTWAHQDERMIGATIGYRIEPVEK